MQELDDNALLREYAGRGSEEAFATIVTRHINKVYSVALRHTGNPHQAEEISQAVFVLLARKCSRLGKRVILEGWLYQTARLTSLTFIRGEIRRARREQEAYVQTISNENESEVWTQIAPMLDTAMARLNETDRHAVVLRFFYGKSMKEIGDAVGGTEGAARVRLHRAVEKLRLFFVKHGVTSTPETIGRAISNHSVQTAPVALAKTVTAAALAKSAAAGGSTLTLAKAILVAMKTKTVVITIAAAAVIIGGGAYLLTQVKPHLHSATEAVAPLQFANDDFSADGDQNGRFLVGVDPDTKRATNSGPAIHIKGPITPSQSTNLNTDNSSSLRYFVTNGSPLLGKHIRLTGWLKTKDVQSWASAFLIIIDKDNRWRAVDSMIDRPIRGTTDWQQVEFVSDVPNEPCVIYFGPDLYGPGELWGDDFKLELAPPGAPITDDRRWHVWTSRAFNYSETLDYLNTHGGHPAVCLAYTPDDPAPKGSFMWWGLSIRDPEKYLGHKVRMTGWVKTENISVRLEPTFKPRAGNGKVLANASMSSDNSLKGTRDWSQFTVTCLVPKKVQRLDVGFCLWGSGKAWLDMDSVKYEIIK